jgi:hypothetical protein
MFTDETVSLGDLEQSEAIKAHSFDKKLTEQAHERAARLGARVLHEVQQPQFSFEIPGEWLSAARMSSFVTDRRHYRAAPPENADLVTIILPVNKIAVRPRGAAVPLFDESRMICVLQGIRLDHEMDPIHVFDEPSGEGRTHVLNDGYHRLAASIAVGFTQVPAVVVRDLDEIKRAESMA